MSKKQKNSTPRDLQGLKNYFLVFYGLAILNLVAMAIVFFSQDPLFGERPVQVRNETAHPAAESIFEVYKPTKGVALKDLADFKPAVEDKSIEILLPAEPLTVTFVDRKIIFSTGKKENYEFDYPANQKIVLLPENGINRLEGMNLTIKDERSLKNKSCLDIRNFLDPNLNIHIIGTNRADSIVIDSLLEPVRVEALQGDDFIDISGSSCPSNWVDGGWGNDIIVGSPYDDRLSGGMHRYEELENGVKAFEKCILSPDLAEDNDEIFGGRGNDTIIGCLGNDLLIGGDGDDTIYGDESLPELLDEENSYFTHDIISGGPGDDYLHGGPGDDAIHGGSGNDTIHGGSGKNRLDGGEGMDVIWD